MARTLLLFALIGLPSASEPAPTPATTFTHLKTLVGDWEGKTGNGKTISVNFRMTAADSVLVETWTLGPGRESMTLYHMDDDVLITTHYCPQRNQPRLQFDSQQNGRMHFRFKDGTNLRDKSSTHQHSFWIEIRDVDSFVRSEKYLRNGSSEREIAAEKEGEPVTFFRTRTAKQ